MTDAPVKMPPVPAVGNLPSSPSLAFEEGWRESWSYFAPKINLRDQEIERLNARIAELEAENTRLREALKDVVDEYPVAAGKAKWLSDDEFRHGYGSIRRARAALSDGEKRDG